jgi:hypothetical protein
MFPVASFPYLSFPWKEFDMLVKAWDCELEVTHRSLYLMLGRLSGFAHLDPKWRLWGMRVRDGWTGRLGPMTWTVSWSSPVRG